MKNKDKISQINAKMIKELNRQEFTKAVWRAVCTIPLGQTRPYKWVAKRIGKPKAMRAVGQALKKNPFPVLVPCHRVIRAGGKLGGYSQGVRRKRKLLALEKGIIEYLRVTK